MFGTTIFGIIVGWLYWRTKSLLPCMVVHVVNNSFAFGATNFFPEEDEPEPCAWVWILVLAFSVPLLMYGINCTSKEFKVAKITEDGNICDNYGNKYLPKDVEVI